MHACSSNICCSKPAITSSCTCGVVLVSNCAPLRLSQQLGVHCVRNVRRGMRGSVPRHGRMKLASVGLNATASELLQSPGPVIICAPEHHGRDIMAWICSDCIHPAWNWQAFSRQLRSIVGLLLMHACMHDNMHHNIACAHQAATCSAFRQQGIHRTAAPAPHANPHHIKQPLAIHARSDAPRMHPLAQRTAQHLHQLRLHHHHGARHMLLQLHWLQPRPPQQPIHILVPGAPLAHSHHSAVGHILVRCQQRVATA